MIFAFLDDGTVSVLESVHAAQREFEGIDVEEGRVHFYDDDGTALEASFPVPNKRGKLLGIFAWSSSGKFTLVRTQSSSAEPINSRLKRTASVNPNQRFSTLEQITSHLHAQGSKGP